MESLISNPYRNERGITLVELLTGIVILAIATILLSVVMGQIFKSESTTSQSISLKQDTNVLINQLRSEYYSDNDKPLCFNHIGDGIAIDLINSEVSNGEFDETGKCIKDVNKSEPLELKLVTERTDSEGKPMKNGPKKVVIQTTFNADKYDTAKGPVQIESSDLIEWEEVEKLPCESEDKNIEWTGQKLNEDCTDNKHVFKGHLKISHNNHELKDHHITVEKNLYVDEELVINKISNLIVKGDAIFEEQLDLDDADQHKVFIHGNALFKDDVTTNKGSTFIINKNVEFEEETKIENGSKFYIGGNALFNKQTTFNNSKTEAFINGGAQFKSQATMGNGAKLTIKENAEFTKGLQDKQMICIQGAVSGFDKSKISKSCDYTIPSWVKESD